MTDNELLSGINSMIADAPSIGICPLPFEIIRDQVKEIISDRDELLTYRKPMRVNSYKLYAGQCPRCGVVFLDESTNYCGNCGQALEWGNTP